MHNHNLSRARTQTLHVFSFNDGRSHIRGFAFNMRHAKLVAMKLPRRFKETIIQNRQKRSIEKRLPESVRPHRAKIPPQFELMIESKDDSEIEKNMDAIPHFIAQTFAHNPERQGDNTHEHEVRNKGLEHVIKTR